MARLNKIESFDETINHLYDEYKNQGYEYRRHILQNVVSPEMMANPVNDTPLRQIERLYEYLINSVRRIKLTYAIAFPKNSQLIN